MERYIIIPKGIAQQFTGKAKRNGKDLNWKTIKPVEILSPKNSSILNVDVIQDSDIRNAFRQLEHLPQLDESEIEFMPDEIEL